MHEGFLFGTDWSIFKRGLIGALFNNVGVGSMANVEDGRPAMTSCCMGARVLRL